MNLQLMIHGSMIISKCLTQNPVLDIIKNLFLFRWVMRFNLSPFYWTKHNLHFTITHLFDISNKFHHQNTCFFFGRQMPAVICTLECLSQALSWERAKNDSPIDYINSQYFRSIAFVKNGKFKNRSATGIFSKFPESM